MIKTPARHSPFGLALLVFCSTVLTGCGVAQSKQAAEKVVTRHFQTISTNGHSTELEDYGEQFFRVTTREQWSRGLERLTSKLGTYQRHAITGWRVFAGASTFGSGTTVVLQCQVTYSKHSAQETFTLFKGATDTNYKIVRHEIEGTALLTD